MKNFEKPLNEFTEEELQQRVNQWDPRFGALALYELQRRQQKENSNQISTLVDEVKKLKEITNRNRETAVKNAKSDNQLARIAIVIAIVAVVTQVITGIKHEFKCGASFHSQESIEYRDCENIYDFGIIGVKHFPVEDFVVPLE